MADFLKFALEAETLAVCERIKKGNYRPCLATLPSSTVGGMLQESFGIEDGHGIGFLDAPSFERDYYVYSPRERAQDSAKLPITMEYLRPAGAAAIRGELYVLATPATEALSRLEKEPVSFGGLRQKGFGRAWLTYAERVPPRERTGILAGRLRDDEAGSFGITRVILPVRGYLFRPTSRWGGYWTPALFEGSILAGCDFLFGEDYAYD